MAVVETFLLERLDAAFSEIPDTSLSKLYRLHDQCRKLKESIENKMPKNGAPVDQKIKENLYYLNNVMAEWRMLLGKHHFPAPEAVRLADNLRGKLKQIEKDLQEKVDSERGGMQSDTEFYRWSSRSVDLAKIHGIEDKAMIMERLLVKEGFKAIGIVGMTGVGKTALCQKAFHKQQVKKNFHPRIWVCLSKQPNVDDYKEELVKSILMCLGFEDNIVSKVGQGGLSKLLFALRQQLKRHKYLIVLDDVWNTEEGFKNFCSSLTQDDREKNRLGNGLPKGHGGTVIVTSKFLTMVKNMVGEKNMYSLLPLADNNSCWKIFKDAAQKDGITPPEDLKDEVTKKCAGLPLIAKMLGQIARDKATDQKTIH